MPRHVTTISIFFHYKFILNRASRKTHLVPYFSPCSPLSLLLHYESVVSVCAWSSSYTVATSILANVSSEGFPAKRALHGKVESNKSSLPAINTSPVYDALVVCKSLQCWNTSCLKNGFALLISCLFRTFLSTPGSRFFLLFIAFSISRFDDSLHTNAEHAGVDDCLYLLSYLELILESNNGGGKVVRLSSCDRRWTKVDTRLLQFFFCEGRESSQKGRVGSLIFICGAPYHAVALGSPNVVAECRDDSSTIYNYYIIYVHNNKYFS